MAEEHDEHPEDPVPGRNPMRIVKAAALVLLLAAALIAANVHWHLLPSLQIGTLAVVGERPHAGSRPRAGNVLRLEYKPGLDTPVTAVMRWWIDDPRFGRVGVYVPVGHTPREALTGRACRAGDSGRSLGGYHRWMICRVLLAAGLITALLGAGPADSGSAADASSKTAAGRALDPSSSRSWRRASS